MHICVYFPNTVARWLALSAQPQRLLWLQESAQDQAYQAGSQEEFNWYLMTVIAIRLNLQNIILKKDRTKERNKRTKTKRRKKDNERKKKRKEQILSSALHSFRNPDTITSGDSSVVKATDS